MKQFELNKIYNEDCLEGMKKIPDGSIDMILCDLPYGTIKGMKLDGWKNINTNWDNVIDTELLFKEYERVLRVNGVALLFSQEPYTSHLRTFKSENFYFLYPMIWKKDHFANPLLSKKAPVSYFEDINVFSKKYDSKNLHPLRKYFKKVLNFIGLTARKVNKVLGHRKAEHCFSYNTLQFSLPTFETYSELIKVFGIDKMVGFKPFDELQKNNRIFTRTFNLNGKKNISNVLEFKKDYQGLHPTQKPVALFEYLIKTYSNEGDIVLDNCMGSGTTAIACMNTKRNFIGFELNKEYFEIAQNRIEENKDKEKNEIL